MNKKVQKASDQNCSKACVAVFITVTNDLLKHIEEPAKGTESREYIIQFL